MLIKDRRGNRLATAIRRARDKNISTELSEDTQYFNINNVKAEWMRRSLKLTIFDGNRLSMLMTV